MAGMVWTLKAVARMLLSKIDEDPRYGKIEIRVHVVGDELERD